MFPALFQHHDAVEIGSFQTAFPVVKIQTVGVLRYIPPFVGGGGGGSPAQGKTKAGSKRTGKSHQSELSGRQGTRPIFCMLFTQYIYMHAKKI